jgi:hypothetical protein
MVEAGRRQQVEEVVGWRVALATAGVVASLTPVALACGESSGRGWMAKRPVAMGLIGLTGFAWSASLRRLTPMELMALLWPLGLAAGAASRLSVASTKDAKKA